MGKFILNTILVGIPEEMVCLILTLILLGRFDLIDMYRLKENIRWLIIPILPNTIFVNFCRYILKIPQIFTFTGVCIISAILISYIIKKNPIKNEKYIIIKIVLFSFLANIILGITESIYMPIFMRVADTNLIFINDNIVYNFLFSLPSRLLQVLIISIAMLNEKYHFLLQQFKYIVNSKAILVCTTIFVGLVLFLLVLAIRLINDYNILVNLSFGLQITVGTLLSAIPTVLILTKVIPNNILINEINKIQQVYNNSFMD